MTTKQPARTKTSKAAPAAASPKDAAEPKNASPTPRRTSAKKPATKASTPRRATAKPAQAPSIPEVVRIKRATVVKEQLNARVPLELKNEAVRQVNEARDRGEIRTVEQVVTESLSAWALLPETTRRAVLAKVAASNGTRTISDILDAALTNYLEEN